jgi:hypothetical protein
MPMCVNLEIGKIMTIYAKDMFDNEMVKPVKGYKDLGINICP